MKRMFIVLLSLSLLTACNNNPLVKKDKMENDDRDRDRDRDDNEDEDDIKEQSSWTKSDRNKFMDDCTTGGGTEQLCSCVLGKIEARYASLDEANRKGGEEMGKKLATECLNDNGGDDDYNYNKGNSKDDNYGDDDDDDNDNRGGGSWTTADEQAFLNTCFRNATNAGADEQTSKSHCNCVLKKVEKKYRSYDEANRRASKSEIDAMEQECIQERNNY